MKAEKGLGIPGEGASTCTGSDSVNQGESRVGQPQSNSRWEKKPQETESLFPKSLITACRNFFIHSSVDEM